LYTKPVISIAGNIDEKHRVIGQVIDDSLDPSIVEKVGSRKAASG
jgi:hypothetical protein